VRTLDPIPRFAFVCEVAGQYAKGSSADGVSGQPSIADAMLRNRDELDTSTTAPYSARIVPVEMWDSAEVVGEACEGPAAWAVRESAAADLVSMRINGAVSSGGPAGRSRPLTVPEVLQCEEKYEQVARFLRGKICVRDCKLICWFAKSVLNQRCTVYRSTHVPSET
jgi:hypothetical protein